MINTPPETGELKPDNNTRMEKRIMNKIISLEITAKAGREPNNLYGIVFDNNKIDKFLFVPSDYKVEEFVNIIYDKYFDNSTPSILFDRHGLGIQFEDYFKAKRVHNLINPDINEMAVMWTNAKEYAVTIAMNSNFDTIGKIEFKKMLDELNNFEVEVTPQGICKLKIIDREQSISRALCYLQYLALVKDVK